MPLLVVAYIVSLLVTLTLNSGAANIIEKAEINQNYHAADIRRS